MKKKIVLLQGAFELLNSGHVRAMRLAKAQGDYLIIAVNTPELIQDYKKRKPLLPYKDKKIIIESIRYVDKVVSARNFSPLELLKKYNVDVYMIAPEWLDTKAEEIAYMKSKGCKIKMCHNYKGVIRSSDIRRMLKED
jgi:cytidyltransferase-like protein